MALGKRPRSPIFSETLPPSFSETPPSSKKEITDQAQVRYFLELCRFCKKSLPQDKDVFMYGYMGAFCCTKCREKQMALDNFMELLRQEAKQKKKITSKDEGLERITASSIFSI